MRGNLVYAYGALRALAAWRPATFTVTLDGGEPHRSRGYTVAVANSSAYGGGMLMAPDASLDDGLLDVVMVARHVQAAIPARCCRRVFKGAHVRQAEVAGRARHARSQISADRPFTMYADGDPIAELPATVRVRCPARCG